MSLAISFLKDWIPFKIGINSLNFKISWLKSADFAYNKSHFSSSVKDYFRNHPSQGLIVTNQEALIEVSKLTEPLAPRGFIFHVSRCGSTLISNCLQATNNSIVIDEAQPISRLLMPYMENENPLSYLEYNSTYQSLLKSVVEILGSKRTGNERNLFIKFSSWNSLMIRAIKEIWPDIPLIFIYRDPFEVFNSVITRHTGWMGFYNKPIFVSRMLGVEVAEILNMSLEVYCVKFLSKLYSNEIIISNNTVFINYKNNVIKNVLEILNHCKISINESEYDKIIKTSKFNSKDNKQEELFIPSDSIYNRPVDPRIIDLIEKEINPQYEKLENFAGTR